MIIVKKYGIEIHEKLSCILISTMETELYHKLYYEFYRVTLSELDEINKPILINKKFR